MKRSLVMTLRFPVCCTVSLLGTVQIGAQHAVRTERHYLSGTGSDTTVFWEFRVSGGRRAGDWATIPVPSNWEMQGFGTYRYSDDWSSDPAPDSIGEYRHRFSAPAAWRGRRIALVFDAVMTDTEVKVNGQHAGPVHRGGFYRFRYDVTELLHYGAVNVLEVRVRKFSSDSSVNRAERQADFWLFGGVYRPVWLEAVPMHHVAGMAIDARHDGALTVHVRLGGISSPGALTAQVERPDGTRFGTPLSVRLTAGQEHATIRGVVRGVSPWSAESPARYRLRVQLATGGVLRHEVTETLGFRTVELRPEDGFYVNGVPVRLKGINRHTIWPTSGRTTNRALSVRDAQLIKDMNMNAVRTAHYPPDEHFLDAADSLGLYVIDELTGWQKAYSTSAGRPLVRELVERDVNHPSIVFWANGNEGGWNTDLDADFARHDPQRRPVIHPWQTFNGINTAHYESRECCAGSFFGGTDLVMPTEFLHALYDGGGGAGLEDWWERMLAHPLGVGGFLWAFADEGIVRADRGGAIDVAGNLAPDGVVGPYREKEGSFFAIKRVWSPVYLPLGEVDRLPAAFSGSMRVENRYDFTDLREVKFAWKLLDFGGPERPSGDRGRQLQAGHRVAASGTATSPQVRPRAVGALRIPLPDGWRRHDALALTAADPHGREIYTWTWMIATAESIAARVTRSAIDSVGAQVAGAIQGGAIVMRVGDSEVSIDATTGRIGGARSRGIAVSLRNGPRAIGATSTLRSIEHGPEGQGYVVAAKYDGELSTVTWRLYPNGWLRLDYAYAQPPNARREYLGVTFDYPESAVVGIRWLGRGPYRVWKNRRKGVEFDVWEKRYNDAITGLRWEYPEFKGFHDAVHWAALQTREAPITMVFATRPTVLRLLTPTLPRGAEFDPRHTRVEFPPGDLSFMDGIVPIGTKFDAAAEHGPAGGPNVTPRNGLLRESTVWFRFGGEY